MKDTLKSKTTDRQAKSVPVSNRKLAFQYKEVVPNHKNYLAEQTNHKNYTLNRTKTNKNQDSPYFVDRWPSPLGKSVFL